LLGAEPAVPVQCSPAGIHDNSSTVLHRSEFPWRGRRRERLPRRSVRVWRSTRRPAAAGSPGSSRRCRC
jgi:hypothetical protein